jgi:succinate dehydrogenase / fumarate reductase, flavoprotein subunit
MLLNNKKGVDKATAGNKFTTIHTDVLIIGAGAAGIRTAIELKQNKVDCLVIGKRKHGDAHTKMAAGGINAALGSLDNDDRWYYHAADTVREGHFINSHQAVEFVCKDAPERIKELQVWGCNFNMTDDGKINQRYFGAQSFRRTCFVGDRTGEAMLETLVNKAKTLKVPYAENIFITKIFVEDNISWGALAFNLDTGLYYLFRFKVVVMAAGGYSGIYKKHSSRKDENTGDGPALALEAGAPLKDMEMMQFHPTGMVYPKELEGQLVTEAARGEGALLYNVKGERFMEKYSPDLMELDARDVVARAIYNEIQERRGTETGGVYLDITHKHKSFIKERLPVIYKRFKDLKTDISKEPMEIAPTAHYSMGGIDIDFTTCATSVEGLFAVGETTAGVHGANRLGGNSLLETVVLGKVCGTYLTEFINKNRDIPFTSKSVNDHINEIEKIKNNNKGNHPATLIEELKKVMWDSAGIIRTAGKIEEGIGKIKVIAEQANNLSINNSDDGATLEDAFNLRFMLTNAEAVLHSSLIRQESRGAHYRKDFPTTSKDWQKNILCKKKSVGALEFHFGEVGEPSDIIKKALQEEHVLNYHHLE